VTPAISCTVCGQLHQLCSVLPALQCAADSPADHSETSREQHNLLTTTPSQNLLTNPTPPGRPEAAGLQAGGHLGHPGRREVLRVLLQLPNLHDPRAVRTLRTFLYVATWGFHPHSRLRFAWRRCFGCGGHSTAKAAPLLPGLTTHLNPTMTEPT
jgi:hypothetical protein